MRKLIDYNYVKNVLTNDLKDKYIFSYNNSETKVGPIVDADLEYDDDGIRLKLGYMSEFRGKNKKINLERLTVCCEFNRNLIVSDSLKSTVDDMLELIDKIDTDKITKEKMEEMYNKTNIYEYMIFIPYLQHKPLTKNELKSVISIIYSE